MLRYSQQGFLKRMCLYKMEKKIIFDTDLGGDCDDVMALDLLLAAHRAGECSLVGVTYSALVGNAVPCIYALLRDRGLESIPIGARPISRPDGGEDYYATAVAEKFASPDAPRYTDVPSAVSLLRRLLVQNEQVTVVATGFLTNLGALLRSEGDDVSPLNGVELVRRYVTEFAVMAGNFAHQKTGAEPTPEYNIVCDIPAAQDFFALCPVPVMVSPFELGLDMLSGSAMTARGGENHPDSYSFLVHGSANGRHSWDPVTALYGVYGTADCLLASETGTVTVRGDGTTDFTPAPDGLHRILTNQKEKKEIVARLDSLVDRL